jgi:hypothetical protein
MKYWRYCGMVYRMVVEVACFCWAYARIGLSAVSQSAVCTRFFVLLTIEMLNEFPV